MRVDYDHNSQGLKVKVKVMEQANSVGPASIEGSFFLAYYVFLMVIQGENV